MKINIEKNIYDLNIDDLIVLAKRANNDKRNFLFVSKVLGKHMEVRADVCKAIGYILASLLCGKNDSTIKMIEAISNNDIDIKPLFKDTYRYNENIAVLGFAETATGIGMSVASAIEDSKYLTTTREQIDDMKSILNFEEEHSHATTHKCFLSDKNFLYNAQRIILVDDEITTGKSMLNIIKELKKVTRIKEYSILSILDWRNKEYLEQYEIFKRENDVNIDVLSLVSGNIENDDFRVFYDNETSEIKETINVNRLQCEIDVVSHFNEGNKVLYLKDTGRFGTDFNNILELEDKCENIANEINEVLKVGEKVLVLGHGENIYIPSRIASYIKGDVKFKTTTRSPIYCEDKEDYEIRQKHFFFDRGVKYYFYNKNYIEKNYDKVIFIVETPLDIKLTDNMMMFSLTLGKEDNIKGSYKSDCIFLLKDLTGKLKEISVEEKEELISKGISYSNFISKEEIPNKDIEKLFLSMMDELSEDIASYIAMLSEKIYEDKAQKLVLVSLARAGSPYGILIKRYLKIKYNLDIKHYSISIIRGKGIDFNAFKYILNENKNMNIQFVDGWTGKGSIITELERSVNLFNSENGTSIDSSLAVIADPAKLCRIYGTREDIAVPNSVLNSTVSGLISRTVLNDKFIGKDDFHGAINIDYLSYCDYSNLYVDKITGHLKKIELEHKLKPVELDYAKKVVDDIRNLYDVKDINKIKLSVGEASRVLLRRKAKVLLLKDLEDKNVTALKLLAKIKNVEIKEYKESDYRAIAIIQ